jgi:hypothetical protein
MAALNWTRRLPQFFVHAEAAEYPLVVISAPAGIRKGCLKTWVPAGAGMTVICGSNSK